MNNKHELTVIERYLAVLERGDIQERIATVYTDIKAIIARRLAGHE